VVAATNRDLTGTGFREDLRARLAQWELHLSPLKDRRADVLPLWGFFYGKAAPGRAAMRASPEFLEALVLHDWPTNVRELKTLAEKLSVLVGPDEILDLHHLPEVIQQRIGDREEPWMSDSDSGPDDTLDPRKVPRERLEALLKQYAGNVSEVARALGLYREQVYRRCRHYGLDPGQFR
jgi:DNA-binding NtrC family response regulator